MYIADVVSKLGGKISLVIGNNQEYIPRMADSEASKRSIFYANDLSFSNTA